MKTVRHYQLLTALIFGVGGGTLCGHPHGPESVELASLRSQVEILKQSLVETTKRESEANERLEEIKLRLEAMGASVLDGQSDRLVTAVADYEVLTRRLKEVEDAALALSSDAKNYLATAIAADPDARANLEARLRDLDIAVGLREKPAKDRLTGNLQMARVVSVNSEAGGSIVVVNVGEKESAVIGMPFEVLRNEMKVADALVASTRADVSALLITNLENQENPVQIGDRVSFKRN
ncbi:MAG: hypothetical protein Q7Q71_12315 [Verrucomicrobiota bacterium JB023]|nr:hypothetical protein [Verrucomicrobiota bacterium JB023]